jgi:hypothetical protein
VRFFEQEHKDIEIKGESRKKNISITSIADRRINMKKLLVGLLVLGSFSSFANCNVKPVLYGFENAQDTFDEFHIEEGKERTIVIDSIRQLIVSRIESNKLGIFFVDSNILISQNQKLGFTIDLSLNSSDKIELYSDLDVKFKCD